MFLIVRQWKEFVKFNNEIVAAHIKGRQQPVEEHSAVAQLQRGDRLGHHTDSDTGAAHGQHERQCVGHAGAVDAGRVHKQPEQHAQDRAHAIEQVKRHTAESHRIGTHEQRGQCGSLLVCQHTRQQPQRLQLEQFVVESNKQPHSCDQHECGRRRFSRRIAAKHAYRVYQLAEHGTH